MNDFFRNLKRGLILLRWISQISFFDSRVRWRSGVAVGVVALPMICIGSVNGQQGTDAALAPSPQQVTIEAKVVSVSKDIATTLFGPGRSTLLSEPEYQKFLRRLNGLEGVDLVSAPSVTTRSGQRATIQIVRELRCPTEYGPDKDLTKHVAVSFDTVPVGLTLEVEPSVTESGDVVCVFSPRLVEFVGYLKYGEGYPARESLSSDALMHYLNAQSRAQSSVDQPVFERKEMIVTAVLKPGQTLLLGEMGDHAGSVLGGVETVMTRRKDAEAGQPPVNPPSQHTVFVFLTVRLGGWTP